MHSYFKVNQKKFFHAKSSLSAEQQIALQTFSTRFFTSSIISGGGLYNMKLKKHKKGGLIEVNQIQALVSPKIDSIEDNIGLALRERFDRLHEKIKVDITRSALNNLHGRNHPINYREQYSFQERWQDSKTESPNLFRFSFYKADSTLLNALYFLLFAAYGVIMWFISIYRLFEIKQIVIPFMFCSLLLHLLDTVVKIYVWSNSELAGQRKEIANKKQYFQQNKKDVFFLLYLLLVIIKQTNHVECFPIWLMLAIDAIFFVIIYQKIEAIFSGIKIAILSSKYRYQGQIVQLVFGCLLRVHIFSIILFLSSQVDQIHNWTNSIERFHESWLSKYVYSLYFTCSTMFTVGYGDITPKNLIEVVAIITIEILGIINLGYIINEIGSFMAKLKEGQENIYRNLSQAEKLIQTYQLPQEISGKLRTNIINDGLIHSEPSPQEEILFLGKLSDEISSSIDTYHKLQTIKTSIFFICEWSKKFKVRVAQNLIKSLYAPQQTLPQQHGKERLYIIFRGRMDIGIFSESKLAKIRKTLKTIQFDHKKEVQSNIFGYSGIISGLKIHLQAVARDYCLCYHLGKEELSRIIVQNQQDFEYFHLIKNRIETCKVKQSFEAPQIVNHREHYSPNPYFVLKKDRLYHQNKLKRIFIFRSNRRAHLITRSQLSVTENQYSNSSGDEAQNNYETGSKTLSKNERSLKYVNKGSIMITTRNYRNRIKRKIQASPNDIKTQQKLQFLNGIDVQKVYRHFYPNRNYHFVINRYRKFMSKSYPEAETILKQQGVIYSRKISQTAVDKLLNAKIYS